MAMLADLQRCRRMVASMRGLVMASSLRLQLLKDAQDALVKREERIRATQDKAPLSPRAKYLLDFRAQRIRVIQRQWRKHRWQRMIVEKLKLERKWRAKRGNKRMQLSATTIQRVFRGHRVRKRRGAKPPLSLLATVILVQQQSRLERLHNARLQYRAKLESRRIALSKARHDLELALVDKNATEQKLAKSSTEKGKTGTATSLFVDAKLLDGTVVRMEAHQLLLHQMSEVDRLTETIADLERDMEELENVDPVIHQAACSIQSVFRSYRERKHEELVRKRRRLAEIRRRLSSERCLERMNEGFLKRQHEAWQHNARVLDGLYHIMVAKRLRQHYREKRAVTVIERIYRQRLGRVEAQKRVAWRRTKLRSQLFALKRVRQSLIKIWRQWQDEVSRQRRRRALIPHALERGWTKWMTAKALCLQRLFRRVMALRRCLDDQVVPVLHPGLRHTIASAVASSPSPRDQFLRFYQQMTQTMHAWRVPPDYHYILARRYTLPLDTLPLDQIWSWLLSHHHQQQQEPQHENVAWFLDLRTPFTVRTLRFLAPLSRFFDLQDRVSFQEEQILIHYEALRCVREYLVLLFAHDAVAYTPSSTFSSHSRDRAIAALKQLIADDEGKQYSSQWTTLSIEVSAFMIFHCVWTDLCEHCLAMQQGPLERDCASCGHRHVEKSTSVQPSHAAVAQPLDAHVFDSASKQPQWIRQCERCDFLVLNAFFHALAPRGHVHRELYTAPTLWKIALAKALEPVTALYEQYSIRTLNDLLVARVDEWAPVVPIQVVMKLELFVRLIKQELVFIQRQALP